MMEIIQAETEQQIAEAKVIFREYETWLGMSLCFQGFEEELAGLPGKYAPPNGRLYLAYSGDEVIGCIAMREIETGICEMKRLYLREAARGKGVGNQLIELVIRVAKSMGYEKMRLDTYPSKMGKAVDLYRSHGFYEIPRYYDNPGDDVLFMEKTL
ncbi:MAG: GNAT family N-acetyltransferase [Pyrinomonadaceae bacterium]|nr:GNAT family N-acetyltransferase [Blastocatellia bacterium]MCW5957140.1 GNAT family N-acetyltransferase [Pyrinomonadaceae bacterium]